MWELLDVISRVILKHRPGAIVEIGIGKSTLIFAQIAKHYDLPFYTCDKKNHSTLFPGHTAFIGNSFKFMDQFDKWLDQPAIVFLDGCHDYRVVRKEVDFFLPRLLENGVLFMHDTLPPTKRHLKKALCSDSYRVREELEDCVDYDCFTWPFTAKKCGLTMVMKKPQMFSKEGPDGVPTKT